MADERVKFLVLTDWTQGAVDLAALVAYSQLASGDIPVQLSYVVENEAQQSDADAVMQLVQRLPNGLDSLNGAELTVESFQEACERKYYAAVLSLAASDQLVLDVAQFTVALAQCCAALSFKVANDCETASFVALLNLKNAQGLTFPGWSLEREARSVPAQTVGVANDSRSRNPGITVADDGTIIFN